MGHDLVFRQSPVGYDWDEFHRDGRGSQWPAEYMVRHATVHARKNPGRHSLDIGAGGGAHVRMLLEMGYYVAAMEPSWPACQLLSERYNDNPRVRIVHAEVNDALLPSMYDLIIDNVSLTHVEHPNWDKILSWLRPGGVILTAQFGIRHESLPDSWCHLPMLCDRYGFQSLEYVRHVRNKWPDEGKKMEFTIGVSRYVNEPRKC